jgi:hypothetical protein
MQEKVCFAQHRQQGVVTRTPMLARVMSFERAFLLSLALEHRRIQVQRIALMAWRQTFHLPFGQGFE